MYYKFTTFINGKTTLFIFYINDSYDRHILDFECQCNIWQLTPSSSIAEKQQNFLIVINQLIFYLVLYFFICSNCVVYIFFSQKVKTGFAMFTGGFNSISSSVHLYFRLHYLLTAFKINDQLIIALKVNFKNLIHHSSECLKNH